MNKKILVLLGHPSRERETLCEGLARSYEEGARESGHEVDFIKIAALNFYPVLHEGYKEQLASDPDIITAQQKLLWADHIVIVYPLWQFMIPALLKGFLERALTRGFSYQLEGQTPLQVKALKKKTARLIQTMGMPAFFYRWVFRQHSAKALKSMLNFCGVHPIRFTYFGMVESVSTQRRNKYMKIARKLGESGL